MVVFAEQGAWGNLLPPWIDGGSGSVYKIVLSAILPIAPSTAEKVTISAVLC